MKHIPIESLYAALDSIEKSVVRSERRYRMTLIELIEARRNLRYRCKELFTDEKIAEQIYKYLCEGLDECENKKDTFFQGWAWNNSNITKYAECKTNLYTETKLRFVLDECIEDEELIEKILKALDEVEK